MLCWMGCLEPGKQVGTMSKRMYLTGLEVTFHRSLSCIRPCLILAAILFGSGCGNFMYKQEVRSHGVILKKKDVSCTNPYLLTKGCDGSRLAAIDASLRGLEFKVAFSEDGSTLLVMHEMVTGGTTVLANMLFEAVRTELEQQAISIQSVSALETWYHEGADVIVGFLIKTDGDGFAVLRPYLTL